MDANRFDALSRSLAAPSSRRRAMGSLGAGGILAALTGRSFHAAAATATSCTITVSGLLSAGPDAKGTVDGDISLSIGSDGAIDKGTLTTTDGSTLDVVGQATGRAISLFVDLGDGTDLALIGVGSVDIALCSGTMTGT